MSTKINYLPIIYVRGYAGSQGGVEETVNLPYYGFNLGSTKVRTGPGGNPELYIFESPLVRLLRDFQYKDYFVRVDDLGTIELLKSAEEKKYPQKSLWVYRYYDVTSREVGSGDRLSIEELAENLGKVVDFVLAKTGARKVNLVAHSMGGLVCRALMQNLWAATAENKIDKLFTYASPHGGIHFRGGLGWLSNARDVWSSGSREIVGTQNDKDNFGPSRMKAFLGLPDSWSDDALNDLNEKYPPERVFSLIGTNSEDYAVAKGLSSFAVGPGSDGLVMIKHAYVKRSSRAFVHRSHSGNYGIVNSEEGFQNLKRFLFGDTSVLLSLGQVSVKADLPDRKSLEKLILEVDVGIRSVPAFMTQQSEDHGSAMAVDRTLLEKTDEALYRTYLMAGERPGGAKESIFQIHLRIIPLFIKNRKLWRDKIMPGAHLFQGTFMAAVGDPDDQGNRVVRFGWGSLETDLPAEGLVVERGKEYAIPLPINGTNLASGTLNFRVDEWNTPEN